MKLQIFRIEKGIVEGFIVQQGSSSVQIGYANSTKTCDPPLDFVSLRQRSRGLLDVP